MSAPQRSVEQRRDAAITALSRRDAGHHDFLHTTAIEYGVAATTIRNWITELLPEEPPPPLVPETVPRSAYPLAGIAWCRTASHELACGRDTTGPTYHCLEPCPRQQPIPATVLHQAVLHAVLTAAPALLRRHSRDGQPSIYTVPGLIERVTIATNPGDLVLRWRPHGYHPIAARHHATAQPPTQPYRATTNRAHT